MSDAEHLAHYWSRMPTLMLCDLLSSVTCALGPVLDHLRRSATPWKAGSMLKLLKQRSIAAAHARHILQPAEAINSKVAAIPTLARLS